MRQRSLGHVTGEFRAIAAPVPECGSQAVQRGLVETSQPPRLGHGCVADWTGIDAAAKYQDACRTLAHGLHNRESAPTERNDVWPAGLHASAGIVHVRASASISAKIAPRTSPDRAAVSIKNSTALAAVPVDCRRALATL